MSYEPETGPAPLTSHRAPRRLFTFTPEVTMGTIISMATMLVSVTLAYGAVDKELSNHQIELDALKARDAEMVTRGNERYQDLRVDIKELKATVSDVKESVAIIRGRMAEPSGSMKK